MAYEFVLSGVAMGVLVVAVAAGLARMRDWKRYVPGGEEEAADGTMRFVYVLLGVSLLAIIAVLTADGIPTGEGGALLYILGLGVVISGYLGWGVYTMARSHGRQTSEAVMASAWALGAASLLGITALLLLG